MEPIELAFMEILLLRERVSATALLYALRRHRAVPEEPIDTLCCELRLTDKDTARRCLALAKSSVKASGPSHFSFKQGALVGTWRISEQRGVGLGGAHYLAVDTDSERKGLIRLVRPGLTTDEHRLKRLEERANVGAEPPHKNLTRIDEVGEDFGWVYSVTYDLDAWNLSARLTQGPLGENEALTLMRNTAEALHVAHGYRVTHGGLTTLSLLMDESSRIIVTDFGVGSASIDGPQDRQRPGSRLETLIYAAPELINGSNAAGIDPRSDIYSLGLVLYDALLRPDCQPETSPDMPWSLVPAANPNFRTILSRCLKASPQERYQTMEALLGDLNRVLSGRSPAPHATGPVKPPFSGLRAGSAAPQEVMLPTSIGQATPRKGSKAATAGFLEAVATAAPAPAVPEGFQDQLFANSDLAPSADSSALDLAPSPPPRMPDKPPATNKAKAPLRRKTRGATRTRASSAKEPTKKPIETTKAPGRPSSSSKARSGKRRSTTGPIPVSAESPQPLQKQKHSGRLTRGGSRRSSAGPTRRTDGSGRAVLLLFTVLALIGAAAVWARQHAQLSAEDQARRTAARATFLAQRSDENPSEALELLAKAIASLPTEAALRGELRERYRRVERRAIDAALRSNAPQASTGSPEPALFSGSLPERVRLVQRTPTSPTSVPARERLLGSAQSFFASGYPTAAALALEKLSAMYPDTAKFSGWLERCREVARDMVYVPSNSFLRGTERVAVRGFYLDRCEVSRRAYDAGNERDGQDKAADSMGAPRLPAAGLSWAEAKAFATSLSKRLPTADEFESAWRGPAGMRFPWGRAEPRLHHAVLKDTFSAPAPVGSLPAGGSFSDARDLAGNLREWCEGEGAKRPVLGGSYLTSRKGLANLAREAITPETRAPDLGFRCALDAELAQR